MTSHRRDVRPRYGRIAALLTSITVTLIAALAGLGVFTTGSAEAGAGAHGPAKPAAYHRTTPPADPASTPTTSTTSSTTPMTPTTPSTSTSSQTAGDAADSPTSSATDGTVVASDAVPAASGSGRRIVFSQGEQRVWLLGAKPDDVLRTYLVSGSVTHNLVPGTYSVYSKSRWAVGVDDSGVMQYFVRFTQGPTGAAIGFHTIPTKNGTALQTKAQLGTPQSHGCIRQTTPDAIALWDFAPIGTKVVVVA